MTISTVFTKTSDIISDVIRTVPGLEAYAARARADEASARHTERLRLVAEQARLRTCDATAIAAHAKQDAPLVAREANLQQQILATQEQRQRLAAKHRAELFATSQALGRIEARLHYTREHEPSAAAFVADLTAQLEGLRLQADEVFSPGIDGKRYQRWNNNASIFACGDAITAAIGQARYLWREALTDDELQARLEAMRRLIPAVESRPDGWERL